jgi:hypothetical protein
MGMPFGDERLSKSELWGEETVVGRWRGRGRGRERERERERERMREEERRDEGRSG